VKLQDKFKGPKLEQSSPTDGFHRTVFVKDQINRLMIISSLVPPPFPDNILFMVQQIIFYPLNLSFEFPRDLEEFLQEPLTDFCSNGNCRSAEPFV